MASALFDPLQQFHDTDGKPLEDGYLYFGVANQNPQVNPITVYWDAAGTIPAAQPIRTSGGFPVRAGTAARVYVSADDYSLVVRDKNQRLVLSKLTADGFSSAFITFLQSGTGAVTRTAQAKMRDVVSVKDFGAVGDGIADDTVAIQAAINSGFKTIYFPPSIYNCGSQISLTNIRGINLIGAGYETAFGLPGAAKGTYLRYTGASGSLLALDSCSGFNISDIWFGYNSASYTGELVTTDNTAGLDTTTGAFTRCFFAGQSAAATTAAALLRLEKTIIITVDQCSFAYGRVGLRLVGYVNILNCIRCSFTGLTDNNIYMVSGSNQNLNFYSNTFSPLANGRASAWDQAAGEALQGFTWRGNYHGDVSVAGAGYWVNLANAQAVVIDGNMFGHSGLGAGDYAIRLSNSFGVEITGNIFYDKSLNFASSCGALLVSGNTVSSATIANLAFVQGASTFASNRGLATPSARCKAWKSANQSIPNSTLTAITFDTNFFDVGSETIHSTTVNTSRFTVPSNAAGLYAISFSFTIATGTGAWQAFIRKNGMSIVAQAGSAMTTATTAQPNISVFENASGGDYYELLFFQNSGGPINIIGGGTYASDTQAWIYRLTLQD
jgi:hypothetical protein